MITIEKEQPARKDDTPVDGGVRRTRAMQSFTWSAVKSSSPAELVDVLGRFDPKLVKCGERAEA